MDETDLPWNPKVRKSCLECRKPGTKNCRTTPHGAICECHENWRGPTCWKPPDQCHLTQLQCGSNGYCESEVDWARCICDDGYAGTNCEVNKANISFQLPYKESLLITSTGSVLILSVTQVLVMILKAILLIYVPTNEDDPQSFYQDLRPLVLMIAGFSALLFRHPDLFKISKFECGLWLYIITTCFSLGIALYALEALNAYEVIKLEHTNRWIVNFQGKHQLSLSLPVRVLVPIIAVNGVMLTTFIMDYTKIASRWSCMGNFSPESAQSWFPILMCNFCAALMATDFSYRGFYLLKRVPQYKIKMDRYLDANPDQRDNIKKCQRNIILAGIGPWLLYGLWLTQAISSDWVMTPQINRLAFVFSLAYSAFGAMQTIFCSQKLYSKFVWYAMRFLPERFSPAFDDISLWSREEVLERYSTRKAIMGEAGQTFSIWSPAHPDYLPNFERERMRRQWMLAYAKMRMEHEEMTKSEVLCNLHVKELDSLYEFSEGTSNQIRHLLKQWMSTVYRTDPQPDPEKKTTDQTKLENWFNEFNIPRYKTKKLPEHNEAKAPQERNKYYKALENYRKLYENDPFEVCLVVTVDTNGNMGRREFCRTPFEELDPKVGIN